MSQRNEANEAVDPGTFVSADVAIFRADTLCENDIVHTLQNTIDWWLVRVFNVYVFAGLSFVSVSCACSFVRSCSALSAVDLIVSIFTFRNVENLIHRVFDFSVPVSVNVMAVP